MALRVRYPPPCLLPLQPAVALNNAEMALAGREVAEETAVLMALSGMVSIYVGWVDKILISCRFHLLHSPFLVLSYL